MNVTYKVYEIPAYLLADEWKDGYNTGIFYAVTSSENGERHAKICERVKQDILEKNDEDYTRWVFTGEVFKDINSNFPSTTVMRFRIRDSY